MDKDKEYALLTLLEGIVNTFYTIHMGASIGVYEMNELQEQLGEVRKLIIDKN